MRITVHDKLYILEGKYGTEWRVIGKHRVLAQAEKGQRDIIAYRHQCGYEPLEMRIAACQTEQSA